MLGHVMNLITGAFSPLLPMDCTEVKDVAPGDGFIGLVEHLPTTAIQGQGDVVLSYGNSIGEAQLQQLCEEAKSYDFTSACGIV